MMLFGLRRSYFLPLRRTPAKRRILSAHRTCLFSSFSAKEYPPCFQFALRERSKPSAVRGPVLSPPCIRQRPLAIAGAWQAVCFLVFALHLGAV
jgi:hypothetical protein